MKNLILLFSLALCACSSQLRAPICEQTLTEFPESVRGHFKMVMPAGSIFNESITLKEQEFELRKDGIYFTNAQAVPAPIMGLETKNLCLIQGEIYLQRLNDNSTYSLAKLEPTSYGLMVNDITFDMNEMKTQGVPVFYLPEVKWMSATSDQEGHWSRDTLITGGTPFIYDNRRLSPEATVRLGHLTSLRIMFERTQPKGPKKFGILLSEVRRKNLPKK
jgi:hypothetical protein